MKQEFDSNAFSPVFYCDVSSRTMKFYGKMHSSQTPEKKFTFLTQTEVVFIRVKTAKVKFKKKVLTKIEFPIKIENQRKYFLKT